MVPGGLRGFGSRLRDGSLDRLLHTGHESASLSGRPVSTQPALNLASISPAFRLARPPGRLQAYAALCAVSFFCYIAGRLSGGPAQPLFLMVGLGACGWAWLLARALFDPAPHDARWPRIVVGVIAIMGALSVVAPAGGGLARLVDNAYALSGSAALLLTLIEPLHAHGADMPRSEKRFRIAFLTIFASLVAISILGLQASSAVPGEASRNDLVRSGCALVSLIAGSAAVWFRLRHPLVRAHRSPVRRAPTAEDRLLADRLVRLLRDEALDTESDLRIGDVAARLGQPEYRVSQCISAALGFANFNRLINHYRIDRAKRLLAGEARDRPILKVAFECGFGSVGPFNRAFKAEVGMTPRAFRAASRRLTNSSHAAQDP